MIILRKSGDLQLKLKQLKNEGKKIGFVPTMGALHQGHLALLEQCKATCDIALCSIFVNPAQFNDPADFEKYPVTIEKDIYLLHQAKTDILFRPSVEEIYPEGLTGGATYALGYLENILEGYYRPGHFQGVCRVMHKLLTLTQPDELFMGQKDYQQCMVIKKLIEDYRINCNLNIVTIVREKSGLAMSSRNMRLSSEAHEKAKTLYEALNYIKQHFNTTPFEELKQQAASIILNSGFDKIDYIEICNAADLTPAVAKDSFEKNVVLAAAFIEGVRLIDNLLIN